MRYTATAKSAAAADSVENEYTRSPPAFSATSSATTPFAWMTRVITRYEESEGAPTWIAYVPPPRSSDTTEVRRAGFGPTRSNWATVYAAVVWTTIGSITTFAGTIRSSSRRARPDRKSA